MRAEDLRLECVRLAQQLETDEPALVDTVLARAARYAAFVLDAKVETSETEDVKAT